MRLDVCDLGRTEVILGMPWLAAHNPEINWETGEVKITRCPPMCGKNKERKEKQELGKKKKGKVEEEAAIRWAADDKEDWGKEEEMEMDHHKIEGMVPRRFHRWMKVFGKVESERMPVRKVWDHIIDLREEFMPSKAKVYPLSRNERKEVQNFVNEHLRKGYIRPSKSQQTSPVFFVGKKDGGKRMVMVLWKLWILQSYSWKTRRSSTIFGTLKQEESILIFLQTLTNSLIYPSVVQFLKVTFLVTDSNRLLTQSLFFFFSNFLVTHSDTNL